MRLFVLLMVSLSLSACGVRGQREYREFDLTWSVKVEGIPEGSGDLKVWITVPLELPEQEVANLAVDGDYSWEIVEDPEFGNRAILLSISDPPDKVTVDLSAKVKRYPIKAPQPASLSHLEEKLYLREEALVSLSPRIHALSDSIGQNHRARYDYVLTLMDYDKSAPGWGNGDSERACDVRKGNCTDFHSLFMSLCRAQGVPAVFEMGYPTKPEGEVDRTGGYHCWAWFYRDGAWLPVDISEADKNPERSDFYFGRLDPDRISFSRGRDVKLPGMQGEPLNYLPSGAYVEIDGVPFHGMERSLTYRVSGPETASGDS